MKGFEETARVTTAPPSDGEKQTGESLAPTRAELEALMIEQSGGLDRAGWSTRMDWRFGYFKPQAVYATQVGKLVDENTTWLDVGCGRFIFPGFPILARRLADRARKLVGVDPDETIHENPYVAESHQCFIEEFQTEDRFDLITLRMVAEHITKPEPAVAAMRNLLAPGGRVVIYTVHRWSPFTVITGLVPHALHHPVKRVLWRSEAKDTFPVALKMNTRGKLRKLFSAHDMREEHFAMCDDCTAFGRWRPTRFVELCVRNGLRAIGLRYPEANILGVYRAPV